MLTDANTIRALGTVWVRLLSVGFSVVIAMLRHFLLGVISALSTCLLGQWMVQFYLKNRLPRRWKKIGQLCDIIVYPIKSCAGVNVKSLKCTKSGFKSEFFSDRTFLVYNEDGKCLTGGKFSKLTKVKSSCTSSTLILSADDCSTSVEIPLVPAGSGESSRIGVDCGGDVALWLSRYLFNSETGVRLRYFPLDRSGKDENSADFSEPRIVHLLSEASIRDLNSRLDSAVTPLQFRPNLVINGEELLPYEEDRFDWLKIGDVVFRYEEPCIRCIFTTVNPKTGTRSSDAEPLKTLRRYRQPRDLELRKKHNFSPALGIYLSTYNYGLISLGDEVFIPGT